MTDRDELESIYGGCTAFIGIRPPEDEDYWVFAADLSSKPSREICKAFSTVYDRTERRQMMRHIVFRPTGSPDVTLSLKEQDTVLAQEILDKHFSGESSTVVSATVRRLFPQLF